MEIILKNIAGTEICHLENINYVVHLNNLYIFCSRQLEQHALHLMVLQRFICEIKLNENSNYVF